MHPLCPGLVGRRNDSTEGSEGSEGDYPGIHLQIARKALISNRMHKINRISATEFSTHPFPHPVILSDPFFISPASLGALRLLLFNSPVAQFESVRTPATWHVVNANLWRKIQLS
jgi:hypothetical protein